MNIYVDLTREFNASGLDAILSSGQAVVLHRLAVMSKDGDWILRENESALGSVLAVLAARRAVYRFGAPLDLRWMRGGWSAHLEFRDGPLRIRTDFVTRPPRLTSQAIGELWRRQEACDLPFVDARTLIELKKTNREKDYAVIGELARLLTDPEEQLLTARSARDILDLASRHPALAASLAEQRPALAAVTAGIDVLEAALDAERRAMIHANERRLERYLRAATAWAAVWPKLSKEIEGLSLPDAHRMMIQRAAVVLPFEASSEAP